MKDVRVTIKGVSPLLMHAFPYAPVDGLEKKTPADQAEFAAYRIPGTRELFIPAANVQRALVSAASYSKGKGRGSLARQAAAAMFVTPERLGLGTTDYQIDARPVVIAATKGRIVRYRPRLDNWQVEFTLNYDEVLFSEKQAREVVDNACSRVGFLDFRPEKRGSFGRAMVVSWQEL